MPAFVDLLDDAIRLPRKSSENADDAEDYLYIICPGRKGD
jgi:hypothetical protein